VKDFDIWFFFALDAKVQFPYRWHKQIDLKLTKFGASTYDVRKGFRGRRIDLFGRAIASEIVKRGNGEPARCIENYLEETKTKSAKLLSKKAVVGPYPDSILGKVI